MQGADIKDNQLLTEVTYNANKIINRIKTIILNSLLILLHSDVGFTVPVINILGQI